MNPNELASPALFVPAPASVRPRRFEIVLGIALLLAIAVTFWTQQRYPALLGKLHSGRAVQVHGLISFDALLPITPQMPLPLRVFRTSINWLWTNKLGMLFALPFGAAMMTLMAQTVRPKRFASTAGNVLCGAVAGAPMGVCTNCATPIGQSLLAAGASSRLTVAAMISSPSFNPVVLALAFVLFPLPLAMLRLAVPLALLLMLPWLLPETEPSLKTISLPWEQESLGKRLAVFTGSFGKNLLRVLWMTLPWMLLAAVLGALAGELMPAYASHLHASPLTVVVVAIFGTLLPVPMALDVALAFVLMRAGAPLALVAALLCTLGPVSIYSLSALGQQLGRPVMLRLALATMALGTLAGWAVLLLH